MLAVLAFRSTTDAICEPGRVKAEALTGRECAGPSPEKGVYRFMFSEAAWIAIRRELRIRVAVLVAHIGVSVSLPALNVFEERLRQLPAEIRS